MVKISPVVYDLGVSDARTSVNFFLKLATICGQVEFYAIDIDAELTILQQRRLKVAINKNFRLLQITRPPFVFNIINRDSYRLYPLNHLIRFPLERFVASALIRKYQKDQLQAGKKICLFSAQAKQLSQQDPRFHLMQHDVLLPIDTSRAGMVRVMNLLTPSNFRDKEILIVLKNIFDALAVGGLLVIGNNEEPQSVVNGAVYRKSESQFDEVWRGGEGSLIDESIRNYQSS